MKEVNVRESETKVYFDGRHKEHRSTVLLILGKEKMGKVF
jgi:hypothetical protein